MLKQTASEIQAVSVCSVSGGHYVTYLQTRVVKLIDRSPRFGFDRRSTQVGNARVARARRAEENAGDLR